MKIVGCSTVESGKRVPGDTAPQPKKTAIRIQIYLSLLINTFHVNETSVSGFVIMSHTI